MVKVIVFDFDGVIIRRSEFFKQESWPLVFTKYGEKGMTAFREGEKKYGGGRGGDRFDILRHAFEQLGEDKDDVPALVQEGARVFDEQVQSKILAAGVTDKDRQTLERLSKRLPLYLNSATPKEALERTISNLKLQKCIKGALGRPNSKIKNFSLVSSTEHISPGAILFVGDADTDYQAAQQFGCAFVGLGNEWNKWEKDGKPFPVVHDLGEVETFI